MEEVEDELHVIDGMADVAQRIGEDLHLLAVIEDGEGRSPCVIISNQPMYFSS